MKKVFIFAFAYIFSSNSYAEIFVHTDTINRLGGIESRENGDYVVLNGFTSAGTCPLSGGLVVARFRSEGGNGHSTFSLALAAKISNKKVTIAVDDAVKNANGSCFVHSVTITE
ncbi:hypothetical protein FM037_20780 [Shewanella psychropiezotolerans]|uniref:Uncharacterized protein n=1 Tax=Shewanella psychropiezotolerans TaxID=2593655 RepID=A0ABX5X1M7_9GAMM|nr:hypothetical protein [Shewanella psychropiezotolerans]QDO85229.1 hypothetical protein FM037_20780 [Shewanella psychropiezotolerans]